MLVLLLSLFVLSTGQLQCPPTDVVFLVDGSSSLGQKHFLNILGFAKEIMIALGLSPEGNRAIVVQFTDEVTREHPGVITSINQAVTVCTGIDYHMGADFLDVALDYSGAALKEVERQGAKKAIVIITDGESQSDPIPAALRLRVKNIGILGVLVQETEENMSNAKAQLDGVTGQRTITVDRFSLLNTQLAETVARLICEVVVEPENPSPASATLPEGQSRSEPINCIVEYLRATPCSKSCGGGEKIQTGRIIQRQLNGGRSCPELRRVLPCGNKPCPPSRADRVEQLTEPIDCVVEFFDSTSCSASCGGGFKVQTATILVEPANGGLPCPELLGHMVPCNTHACGTETGRPIPVQRITESDPSSNTNPIVIQKTPSALPVGESNVIGTTPRNPDDAQSTLPSHSGTTTPRPKPITPPEATTPAVQNRDCEYKITYGECSATCGQGLADPVIEVLKKPEGNGKECPEYLEPQECNKQECPKPTAEPKDCVFKTTDWSLCTTSCGEGFRLRRIHIISKEENGGRPCPLGRTEREPCNLGNCPIKVNFDCTEEVEGDHPLTMDGKNCSQNYVTCAGGTAYLRNCADGLYYHPETHVCDDWVYACGGRKREIFTSAPGKEEQHDTRNFQPLYNCARQNGYFPDPQAKCTSHFYICSHGTTVKQDCPTGLFYSNYTQRCDVYDNVYECTGEKPVTDSTVGGQKATQAPVEEKKYPINCERMANGEHENPSQKCSRVYYTCDNGRTHERECVPGTYFAIQVSMCLARQHVPSCGGTLPQDETTAAPSGPPTPAPLVKIDPNAPNCDELRDGNYAADNCSTDYYTCNFGDPILRHCPRHLKYDAEFDRCELKKYIPLCGGKRPKKQEKKATEEEKLAIDCKGKPDRGYQDPSLDGGCSQKYIMCANELAFRFECPGDLFYDEKSDECRLKKQIKACN